MLKTGDTAIGIFDLGQCGNLDSHINMNEIARDLTGNYSSKLQILFVDGSVLQ